ncbi:tyrosine-type recombinase/integrase [Paenibacillus gorillae]|uniref:tyrosine-type recombinase/integrase n=1 Tax=Paenibacillus gorillae TaxID=1243662 RepID=UPI003B50358B
MALTTGMRQSEILGVRWRDIDFENDTISIRQTLCIMERNWYLLQRLKQVRERFRWIAVY